MKAAEAAVQRLLDERGRRRAAGAGLQARIKRLAARAVRARREERRAAADGGARHHVLSAVFSGPQLGAELHIQIVGRQKPR